MNFCNVYNVDEIVCPEGAEAVEIDELGAYSDEFLITSGIDETDQELLLTDVSLYRQDN